MAKKKFTIFFFTWDYKKSLTNQECWNKDVRNILIKIEMEDLFYGPDLEREKQAAKEVGERLRALSEREILNEIGNMPKLRAYKTLKTTYGTPMYVNSSNK